MNPYPVGVSQLLLAPPPPPPPPPVLPPDYAVTEHGQTDNAAKGHQPAGPLVIHHVVPLAAMIPPSHLSLPPPPPPPPPEAANGPHSMHGYSMPFPNNMHPPPENYGVRNNIRPHFSAKPYPFRGPAPWAPPRQVPPGLQGPWQAPSCDRPSGVYQQLHQPGVPGLENLGEVSSVPATDATYPPGTLAPDTINSLDSKASPTAITYKDTKVDPKDPRLPKELTNLFEALNCKLCEVVSSSTVQAKHHYSGKPHEKKVRQWLQKWSEETGQPLPKRPKLDPVADVKPEDLYCKVCEVAFTSVKHGEQHKMGKPHQKALRLGYAPHKSKLKKVEVPTDPTGRFGIGESFQKEPPSISTEICQQEVPPVEPAPVVQTPAINSKYYCDLCKISATSQDHLDSHYAGAKHRKAIVNAAKAGLKPEALIIPAPVEPAESILASVISESGPRSKNSNANDLSIYRTPSGQFYCHPCNTTVNSEKTFRDHSESKRHKFKVALSKRS